VARTYGLIIGSGWERLVDDDTGSEETTAYGEPSARVHRLRFADQTVLTLARHGDCHTIPPHAINYRANVLALKKLGVQSIIALNTVGVITTVIEPGGIAIPDQLIDYTWGRAQTLFDGRRGIVEHVDFTNPFSAALRRDLLAAARKAGVVCHDGGVCAVTQGPRLETAAEIVRLERDGADFVGMTAMPEAAIAREARIDYACIAMIVNRAAGQGEVPIHDDVDRHTVSTRNATLSTLDAFFAAL
jgi:5'-methylthioinosine phosphorylase